MKISSAPAYEIINHNPELARKKVEIHNTGHHMRVLAESTYTKPIDAVVRETIANAMDASKGAQFDVTAPSLLDPNFRVRDYGVGMDEEFFLNGYARVGFSTKRDANDEIGGFGQGRFAAFAYKPCDTYYVRGVRDHKWFLGQVQRDHEFEIFVSVVGRGDTVEANGVEVFVPVETKDHGAFLEAIKTYTEFVTPTPNGLSPPVKRPVGLAAKDGSWTITRFKDYSHGNNDTYDMPVRAIMGGVPYKLNFQTVFGSYNESGYLNIDVADIHFPIGSLQVPASREELRYDDATKNAIKQKLLQIRKEIQGMMEDSQKHLTTDWEKWTDKSNIALHRALGTADKMKTFQAKAIPGLLVMQTLAKAREFEGRSKTIASSFQVALDAHYHVYVADVPIWRKRFEIDITDKANTTVVLGNGRSTQAAGMAIVVDTQKHDPLDPKSGYAGVVALGNPPFTLISSLPVPPKIPKVVVPGTNISQKRVPEVYSAPQHGGTTWHTTTAVNYTNKGKIYWPMAITKLKTEYERLWEQVGNTTWVRDHVGVPMADEKLAIAAGWTKVDDALKAMCGGPDMVQAFSLIKGSEIITYYNSDKKTQLAELFWLLNNGFKMPHADKDLEAKIRLIGPLIWNKADIYTHLVRFMEHTMATVALKGAPYEIDKDFEKFMTEHPLLEVALSASAFSQRLKNQKADVPTLLAMAKKAL